MYLYVLVLNTLSNEAGNRHRIDYANYTKQGYSIDVVAAVAIAICRQRFAIGYFVYVLQ